MKPGAPAQLQKPGQKRVADQRRILAIQSPTRVDLAGGTLDCWPLYLFVGDCVTVNLAIDVTTGCELEPLAKPTVEIEMTDLNFRRSFENARALFSANDPELKLVQTISEYFYSNSKSTSGFRIKTYSQSPVGGGLGGSSSLCISLIKAFCSWLDIKLSLYEMVTLASNLEAKVIRTPTGTQDYFPAIQSGFNLIHYSAAGVRLEQLPIPVEPIFDHLILVYTGRAHHSGINNWEVIKSVIDGDAKTLAALKDIAKVSDRVANACREQKWNLMPDLFQQELEARIRLTASFTSPEIEQLKRLTVEHGAQAIKICGAGGGGCVLVWAERSQHERIRQECRKNGFQPINIRPANPQPALG